MGIAELVERSGPLKRELLIFAADPRFEQALRQQLRRRSDALAASEKEELDNFFDWFVQQYRLPDGRTVIDCFLEERTDLSQPEREFLLGWHDVVQGHFEVIGHEGPVLLAVNLIDELEYRIRANVRLEVFDQAPAGSFVITRVVPVHDEWLVSGVSAMLPADDREELLKIAADTAMRHPTLVYRNPHRLARAWEIQQTQRAAFVEHFGADTVVLEVTELRERMREYGGSPVTDDWVSAMFDQLPPRAVTVGLIYDEEDGLGAFADYRMAEEVFANPHLIRERKYRRLIKKYLTDDSVTPVPLVRLAERDHDKADQVFGWLTHRPGFSWAADGEALLRHHKPWWYKGPRLPRTVVFSERLAPYVMSPR